MEHAFLLSIDVRFPGGTSSAVVNELKSLATHFDPEQIGILCVDSALFSKEAPTNDALVDALRSCPFPVYRFDPGQGAFVDWNAPRRSRAPRNRKEIRRLHGQFLIVHNPYVALALAPLTDKLSADIALVVCHQPYLDTAGVPYYSAADIVRAATQIAREMRFVPIGAAGRAGFLNNWTASYLADFDWPNVFDFGPMSRHGPVRDPDPSRYDPGKLVIGRHSRPEWVKWPESRGEFAQIYQHGTKRLVRFLGWGSYCDELFKGDVPSNWDVMGFNAVDPSRFLQSIDAFVYYHHSNWVEGFGRTVAEAMAAGVPCILTPALASTFGGAALYSPPARVASLLDKLDHKRDELAQWSTNARDVAKEAFGLGRVAEIYERLSDALTVGNLDPKAFSDIENEIARSQRLRRQGLDAGFALQEQLGLLTDASGVRDEASSAEIIELSDANTTPNQSQTTDFAIYMDLRSARSDLWRTVELAESLSQAGYAVSLVHVETKSKTDFSTPNPILDELSADIPIYGRRGDLAPRYLEIKKGLIVAAPHLMFAENGRPLFDSVVRPVTSAVVVLLDKKQAAQWYQGADESLALMCGLHPKWALINLSAEELKDVLPHAVEVPELSHFVANRAQITRRDLLKHMVGRQGPRRGRIGLMDVSQWRSGDTGTVENFGAMPVFAYATSPSRLVPEDLQGSASFHPFRASEISLTRFLEKIDLLTYFPSDKPNDLMLIPILRAVQAGVLAVVDGELKKHLGPVAVYSTPHELSTTVERLSTDQDQIARTALSKARELVLAGLQHRAVEAVENLISNGAAVPLRRRSGGSTARALRSLDTKPEVLFVSSNGVGLGHLTRLMAIARRLRRCEPVFLTMSQAFRIVEVAGWPVKYVPFHEVSGCNVEQWNLWLAYEVEQILSRRPSIRSLVFDGSNPYSGLLSAFASSDLRKVWIQRGMWKEGHMNAEHVRRGKNFDIIIEPSDVAESLASAEVESPAFDKLKTNPIRLLDPDELLTRTEARSKLGIPQEQKCCLIQLGSGTNRDIVSLLSVIIPILKKQGISPYIAEWLMGSEVPRLWPSAVYLRVFPLAKYFAAFDFSISAAGYNSFHDILGFGLPTIFIANEHQMMDDQAARAKFAMRNDAGLWIAEEDIHEIGTAIDLINRDDVRAMVIANCAALTPTNGAIEAAQVIDLLSTGPSSEAHDESIVALQKSRAA